MILAVKILLGAITLALVIWPFLHKKSGDESVPVAQDETLHNLILQKESAYAAIKELDFDYNMGKLSEEDYQELKQQYKQKAVALLQQIDALSARSNIKGTVNA